LFLRLRHPLEIIKFFHYTCFLFFGQNFTSSQGQDLETQIRKPNSPQTQTQSPLLCESFNVNVFIFTLKNILLHNSSLFWKNIEIGCERKIVEVKYKNLRLRVTLLISVLSLSFLSHYLLILRNLPWKIFTSTILCLCEIFFLISKFYSFNFTSNFWSSYSQRWPYKKEF